MWDSDFLKKYKSVSWRGDDKSKIEKSDGTQQNKNRDGGGEKFFPKKRDGTVTGGGVKSKKWL